jgi:hypothetical protein
MACTSAPTLPTLRPRANLASLKPLLASGDRRSIAQSNRVRALLRAEPDRVEELARLAEDRNWLVSMRALDLLEKIAHDRRDLVQPHRRLFIGPLADSDKWEIHHSTALRSSRCATRRCCPSS